MSLNPHRGFVAGSLVVLMLLASQPPAAADARSQRYDVGLASAGVVGVSTEVDDPVGATEDGSLQVGAVRFDPLGGIGMQWVRFTVQDDLTPSVSIIVCSDVNADGICGAADLDRFRGPYVVEKNGYVELAVHTQTATTVFVGAGACVYLLGFVIPFPCGVGLATSGVVTMTQR